MPRGYGAHEGVTSKEPDLVGDTGLGTLEMPSRTGKFPVWWVRGERGRGKRAAGEVPLSDLVQFGDRLLARGGTELSLVRGGGWAMTVAWRWP